MSKKDEEQHEWDLWQINGLLDHRIAFKVLDQARLKLIEAGQGPDHTYECVKKQS